MNPKTSRLVGIVSIVLVLLAFAAVPRAHTKLQKTEPADGAVLSAAPQHVELWFDEKPDVSVSKIEVAGPSGNVDLAPTHSLSEKSLMAVVKGNIGDGKYIVTWQAAGDDGHVSKGTFSFTLKRSR
jgi:methionine-rich copper-binding protein CopC